MCKSPRPNNLILLFDELTLSAKSRSDSSSSLVQRSNSDIFFAPLLPANGELFGIISIETIGESIIGHSNLEGWFVFVIIFVSLALSKPANVTISPADALSTSIRYEPTFTNILETLDVLIRFRS